MTDRQKVDWLTVVREYEIYALNGWPGVQTPHYALSGGFKAIGDEIEALRVGIAKAEGERDQLREELAALKSERL